MFDKGGYPTDAALEKLKEVAHQLDHTKTISLLEELWHYGPPYFNYTGQDLFLSTGGWSGNESIISALEGTMFWWRFWQKSERGGHYYFSGWKEEEA